MRYQESLEPVLKEVTFKIQGAQKVGVVGRTGAGKSSLLQALFRLKSPEEGSILLDGVDTASLGFQTLRRAFSIIPQAPFIFAGTIRRNLDPFHEFPDASLW